MRSHLKPLFIRGKIENTRVNKILVDGGVVVNLMPYFMLKRNGKFDTDLRPHNMVLSNYEGNIGHTLGVIQVDLIVGYVTRLTLFMVITSKATYNLLLGREWIHNINVVPFLLHQRILIWREDKIVENIESDQIYFMAEVNHVDKRHFDKHFANISPCSPVGFAYLPSDKAFYSLYLHPTHGFRWYREIMGDEEEVEGVPGLQLTCWGNKDNYHV